ALAPQRTDLVGVLRQAVELQQATAAAHPLRLEAPDHLWGTWDPQRLAQVAANLIGNAIKYAPKGTEVRVKVWQEEGTAAFAVAGRGRGIGPAYRSQLFEGFPRGEHIGTVSGLGLGLAIARGIVEGHGGRIGVDSQLGGGSTFWVRLPLGAEPPDATAVSAVA